MRLSKAVVIDFMIPIALLVSLTALIAATGADLLLESRFFVPPAGWVYARDLPWGALYEYGVYPSLAVATVSFLVIVAGCFSARACLYRKCAMFFLLLMLLGPGLLVNSVLKDHWGRPRPRQMQMFGGDRSFHQVWERGETGKGVSFPSGHASAAFYLMAPYFIFRRSSRKWATVTLIGGCAYGIVMGIARMVQGGHFLSDVVWAGGTVYLVGLALYYLLGLDRELLVSSNSESLQS